MNKQGRKRVEEARELLEQAHSIIEELQEEEEEKLENMPDGIRESEKGEAIETAAGLLSDADDSICEAMDQLEEI